MRRRFAIPLALGLALFVAGTLWTHSEPASATMAQHLASRRWHIAERWFGGFSALDISPDGQNLLAISDRGYFVEGDLIRQSGLPSGKIVDVQNLRTAKVLRKNGRYPKAPGLRDAEGVARLSSGALVVSFEGDHRLEQFASPGARPTALPALDAFEAMAPNAGVEALAVDASGTLFAAAERAVDTAENINVYALTQANWHLAFVLPREKQFQPVGADFGPDGRFYLLERGFNGLGFRTRVRSFATSKDGAFDEKLLFQRGIGFHDNLEGLSVWRDDTGQIRLTMISDDNFRLIQRTEIVEYIVPQ